MSPLVRAYMALKRELRSLSDVDHRNNALLCAMDQLWFGMTKKEHDFLDQTEPVESLYMAPEQPEIDPVVVLNEEQWQALEKMLADASRLVALMQRHAKPDLLRFMLRVMRAANNLREGPGCDSIWWRTDGEYAPVTFLVNCSDLFAWACADAEPLTPENVEVFEQAIADCQAAVKHGEIYAPELFCARVRKMRPQGASYPEERDLWPLFDACGPEREVGFGNPYAPGKYRPTQRLNETSSKP